MSKEFPLSDPGSQDGPRKKYVDDFELGQTLGSGAFGDVKLCKDKETGREYAIKILLQKQIQQLKKTHEVMREKEVLNLANHPNIVRLYYTFRDPQNLYFVLELCPNGDLLGQLKKKGRFDGVSARFYAAEILSALFHLQEKGVVHRDLKPENIMLDPTMHAKLTDFGTAKVIGADKLARTSSFVGTPEYMAPELLLGERAVGLAFDLWGLGCIIYQLLVGRIAFRGPNDFQTFELIKKLEYAWPDWMEDAEGKDLVTKLLTLDPTQRLGYNSAVEVRDHPFFRGLEWSTLATQEPPPIRDHSMNPEMTERGRKLEQQKGSVWASHLNGTELVIFTGPVSKKKGIRSRKRQLILTDHPRLIYIDPAKGEMKGEISWSSEVRPYLETDRKWFVETPGRTFVLECLEGNAKKWVDGINAVMEMWKKRKAAEEKKEKRETVFDLDPTPGALN